LLGTTSAAQNTEAARSRAHFPARKGPAKARRHDVYGFARRAPCHVLGNDAYDHQGKMALPSDSSGQTFDRLGSGTIVAPPPLAAQAWPRDCRNADPAAPCVFFDRALRRS